MVNTVLSHINRFLAVIDAYEGTLVGSVFTPKAWQEVAQAYSDLGYSVTDNKIELHPKLLLVKEPLTLLSVRGRTRFLAIVPPVMSYNIGLSLHQSLITVNSIARSSDLPETLLIVEH